MPGNIVQINNSKEFEWYVGDSQMDRLIEWLNEYGLKENEPAQATPFKEKEHEL